MTFHYLPIVALIFAVLLAVGLNLLKPGTKATRWAVKARLPVSPVEQQLYRRLIDAFPKCIVLCQVAVSSFQYGSLFNCMAWPRINYSRVVLYNLSYLSSLVS